MEGEREKGGDRVAGWGVVGVVREVGFQTAGEGEGAEGQGGVGEKKEGVKGRWRRCGAGGGGGRAG